MKVQASITVKHGMTVAELNKALTVVPETAQVSISTYRADRPGESSYSTMTFSWDIQ